MQVSSKVEFTAGYTKTKNFPLTTFLKITVFAYLVFNTLFVQKNRLLYLGLPIVAVVIVSLFPSFSNTLLLADFDTAEGLRIMRTFSTGTWGSSVSGVLGSP